MKERIITCILASILVTFVCLFVVIGFTWVLTSKIVWNDFHTKLSIFAFTIYFIVGLVRYKDEKV